MLPIDIKALSSRVGKVLGGRYTLDALIGVGGMAAVYRGHHRNGNRVAIKLLHPELSILAEVRQRFLREGYLANLVDHPGAVRVLDDEGTDNDVFLVMDLLEGITLEERLERASGTLPADEIVPIAIKVLEVLAAAHASSIVHRDVKPENIFLEANGGVRVLDFGIARLRDGSSLTATRTGHLMGTPAYMAPEQARGELTLLGPHTDVWAVGALMFRALTGRFVHEAETPELAIIFAATKSAVPLATLVPSLSADVARVVDRALELEPEHRWASALEMARALGGAETLPRPTATPTVHLPATITEIMADAPRVAMPSNEPESEPATEVMVTAPSESDDDTSRLVDATAVADGGPMTPSRPAEGASNETPPPTWEKAAPAQPLAGRARIVAFASLGALGGALVGALALLMIRRSPAPEQPPSTAPTSEPRATVSVTTTPLRATDPPLRVEELPAATAAPEAHAPTPPAPSVRAPSAHVGTAESLVPRAGLRGQNPPVPTAPAVSPSAPWLEWRSTQDSPSIRIMCAPRCEVVDVDGSSRGSASSVPLDVDVRAGAHTVRVRSAGQEREVHVTVPSTAKIHLRVQMADDGDSLIRR